MASFEQHECDVVPAVPAGTQWRDWRKGVEGAGTTCDLCDPGTFADAECIALPVRGGSVQNRAARSAATRVTRMVAPAEGSVACRPRDWATLKPTPPRVCCDVAWHAALQHHAHYIAAGSCDSACDGVSMAVPDAGSDEQLCGMALDCCRCNSAASSVGLSLAAPVLLGALLVFVLALAPPVRRCVARRRAAAAERRRRRAVAAAEAADAEGAAEGAAAGAAEGDGSRRCWAPPAAAARRRSRRCPR